LINPSKLGLGCSRLGSTLSGKKAQAVALLTAAQENGINVFDTANICGQGDSGERSAFSLVVYLWPEFDIAPKRTNVPFATPLTHNHGMPLS
jgi:predicted oxidoreductase